MSILFCMRDGNGNCRENGLTMEQNHIVRPLFHSFVFSADRLRGSRSSPAFRSQETAWAYRSVLCQKSQ